MGYARCRVPTLPPQFCIRTNPSPMPNVKCMQTSSPFPQPWRRLILLVYGRTTRCDCNHRCDCYATNRILYNVAPMGRKDTKSILLSAGQSSTSLGPSLFAYVPTIDLDHLYCNSIALNRFTILVSSCPVSHTSIWREAQSRSMVVCSVELKSIDRHETLATTPTQHGGYLRN